MFKAMLFSLFQYSHILFIFDNILTRTTKKNNAQSYESCQSKSDSGATSMQEFVLFISYIIRKIQHVTSVVCCVCQLAASKD